MRMVSWPKICRCLMGTQLEALRRPLGSASLPLINDSCCQKNQNSAKSRDPSYMRSSQFPNLGRRIALDHDSKSCLPFRKIRPCTRQLFLLGNVSMIPSSLPYCQQRTHRIKEACISGTPPSIYVHYSGPF